VAAHLGKLRDSQGSRGQGICPLWAPPLDLLTLDQAERGTQRSDMKMSTPALPDSHCVIVSAQIWLIVPLQPM
jgi:hypothetical protein